MADNDAFHERDMKGWKLFERAMKNFNVQRMEHTASTYDSIDGRLTGTTANGTTVWAIEQKNRDCLSTDYDTVMFNLPKYRKLCENYTLTGEIPVFVSSYPDAVLIFNLLTYPKDKLTADTREISRTTVDGGRKYTQPRLFLDPQYAYRITLSTDN